MDRTSGLNYIVVDGLRKFTDSPPGTVIPAVWLNGVQEEIMAVIEQGGGFSGDPSDNTQLLDAINDIALRMAQSSTFNVRFVRTYSSDLAVALAAIGTSINTVLVIDGPVSLLDGSVTVPANVTLWFLSTGLITLNTFTLTINGGIIADHNFRIFNDVSSGKVTVGAAVKEVYPNWWYTGTGTWATAIQSAINSHHTVAFVGSPEGGTEYNLSGGADTITVPDAERTIVGYGRPQLKGINVTNGIFLVQYRKMLHLKDLSFESGSGTGRIIRVNIAAAQDGTEHLLVENCQFGDGVAGAINYFVYMDGAGRATFRNCQFLGPGDSAYGIWRNRSNHTTFEDCTFSSMGFCVFDQDTSGTVYSFGSKIINCVFENVSFAYRGENVIRAEMRGCRVKTIALTTATPVTILGAEGVVIEDNEITLTDTSPQGGISFTRHTTTLDHCYDVTVRGNKVYAAAPGGSLDTLISLWYCHNAVVENNNAKGYNDRGINIENSDTMIIRHNYVEPTGTGGNYSIEVTATCTKDTMIIEDNYVEEVMNILGGRLRNNYGYQTANRGSAAILSAGTTVDVPHSCDLTPDWIMITPKNTNDTLALSTIDATTFTVKASAALSTGCIFYWRAANYTWGVID